MHESLEIDWIFFSIPWNVIITLMLQDGESERRFVEKGVKKTRVLITSYYLINNEPFALSK